MSEVKVNKISPRSGTDVTLGDASDTFTVPSGVTLTTTNATVNLPTTVTATTEVKTNKISPATGTAFTLGDSGDTFTIPSGATLTNSGTATGFASIAWQSVVTGATLTAVAGRGYPINTTSNACTVTLPAGSVGDTIELVDYAGTWDTNKVTLTADGSEKIKGSTDDAELKVERQGIQIVYVDATQGWVGITGLNETAPALGGPTIGIEYLCVAGGGGGGHGYYAGGGGAGGYLTATQNYDTGSAITITVVVGSGGAGGPNNTTKGSDGGLSSIASSAFSTITSDGGGGGGTDGDAGGTNAEGSDGGSGGGSGGNGAGTQAGGSATAGQGNAGGTLAGNYRGAGGGGAGATGGTGWRGPTYAMDSSGGDGLQSDILIASSDVYYAGGGGGGLAGGYGWTAPGGDGGGGDGGTSGGTAATAGTDGLGGGGGGSGGNIAGLDGGNGIVVLRVLTSVYSGTTTGSPTITTDGSYTVMKFLAAGTYDTE